MKAALIILAIHGGGWVFGAPSELDGACASYESRGVACESVAYTLGDYPAAVHDLRAQVRAAQRSYNRVALYGLSAGGTLAAYLAARGEVDAAVVEAAPASLRTWQPARDVLDERIDVVGEEDRWSPHRVPHRRASPILGLYAPEDPVVGMDQAVTLAGTVGARIILKHGGPHARDPRYDDVVVRFARSGS